jgi:hypothetical protein
MIKFIPIIAFIAISLVSFAQDAIISSTADRSIEPAFRMRTRPTVIDTLVSAPTINYPLLVIREETSIQISPIEAASIRQRQQLNKLYNGYAKVGGGSRLMGLGEVYYNSLRSRKYNWGVHAQHLSEWGKISNYAPSMYDRSSIRTFGHVQERRYSYGGNLSYMNQGLHYYGFNNPNASRDSISQRFNSIDFSGYYASHPKDSAALNYRIGLDYSYFQDKKPGEDTLSKWRARENFFAIRTNWSYKSSNNVLLSNMEADFDVLHNDYRYGIRDSSLSAIDTGFVNSNTVIQLRPLTHFYGKNEKLQFKFGGEVAVDIRERVRASAYPILQVRYSLFDDLFIPYAGVTGGLKQQRFQSLTRTNEFINSAVDLDNMQRYALKGGITGTLSKRMTFNIGAEFSHNRNMAFFMNDTLRSSGNQFTVIYDTVNIASFTGSLTYQHNERLKIDGIGRYNSYQMRNNPYAWNLPQIEFILRGKYNVANKLYVNIDLTLEGLRRARVFDPTIENVFEQDQMLIVPLGFIADANLSAEYRYTQRLSFFVNFNNFAAQRYQRWYNYPVQAFQFMMGATFRF